LPAFWPAFYQGDKMQKTRNIATAILLVLSIIAMTTNFLKPAIAQEIIAQEVSKEFKQEMECLTQNIYYEAASEPYEGKLAVAQVTLNRLASGRFADTICGVVKQKDKINGATVCQFSWFCNKINALIRNKYEWEESEIVARKALTENSPHDYLAQRNALYYHANYVNPGWHYRRIGQIGNHIFYAQ